MLIAIIHYHLRRGGVTRVLEFCVPSLAATGHKVVVLTGEPPVDESPLKEYSVVVSELGYDAGLAPGDGSALMSIVSEAAVQSLGGHPDIWHVHNHHLGKNLHVTAMVGALARRGDHLLLQIHDFPEDGRPVNYSCQRFVAENSGTDLSGFMYPQNGGGTVHYAVLNSRDEMVLKAGGLGDAHLHSLPNPVPGGDKGGACNNLETGYKVRDHIGCGEGSRFLLYPSRSIRRKNIGEIILWGLISSRMGHPYHIGLTLRPENPDALEIYMGWRDWVQEVDMPVHFEMGLDARWTFQGLLEACDGFISTSVAEGFGLPFLEPWILGKGIVGRDIPDITTDFKNAGVNFDEGLYKSILVPFDWLNQRGLDFRRDFTRALDQTVTAYGLDLTDAQISEAADRRLASGVSDFASLSERQMSAVISMIRSDSDMIDTLIPHSLPELQGKDRILRNAHVVSEHYSVERYIRRLTGIYESILAGQSCDPGKLDARKVLMEYLDPDRFLFLCS